MNSTNNSKKDQFNKSLENLQKVSLPKHDKAALFNSLLTYAEANPADENVPTKGLGSLVEVVKSALAIRFRF